MHTCMVVRPVPSANSRFSLGDGYALCAYHSRRIERDFSWNEWNEKGKKKDSYWKFAVYFILPIQSIRNDFKMFRLSNL